MIALIISASLFSACVEIHGGAIEASWVLRTRDGRAIDGCGCGDPSIARVRFVVVPSDREGHTRADICAGRAECEFSCDSQRGATPFFVPAGPYAISLSVSDGTGMVLPTGTGKGTVRLQAPILRDVVFGQPAQLEAFAIVTGCHEACGGDTPTRACSKD